MKISIIHSFYRASSPSGENVAVVLQAQALENAGHDVQLISRNSDDFMGQRLYPLFSGIRVATGAGVNPNRALDAFQPDIVHIHNLFPNWSTNWLKNQKTPVVATVHNFRPVCAAGTLLRNGVFCDLCPTAGSHHAVKHSCYRDSAVASIPLAIASRKKKPTPLLERADKVLFLASRTQEIFRTYGRGYEEKSLVLPNFAKDPEESVAGKKSNEAKSWIFVGRLSPEKGVLPLIQNWPSDVSLEIVGSGTQESLARDAAVGKQVIFHGQRDKADVESLMRSARGLIFPSMCAESAASLVYLEALAMGLPTISLFETAVSDDIEEFGTGISICSLDELSHAIDQINADYDRYSRAARQGYTERYSEAKWLISMEKVYRDLHEFGRRENS